MSLRLAVASADGFDDETAAKLDRYEESDLTSRQQAAIRFADAYLSSPATIDGPLRELLHQHFSAEEIVELVLDLAKWGTQKIAVSLVLDAPVSAAGHALIEWDERGVSTIVVPD